MVSAARGACQLAVAFHLMEEGTASVRELQQQIGGVNDSVRAALEALVLKKLVRQLPKKQHDRSGRWCLHFGLTRAGINQALLIERQHFE